MTIGPSDLLSAMQNGVNAIRDLVGATSPFMSGAVTAVNSLSTTPVQVIAANDLRTSITFHNPGTVTAYVYPVTLASGALNSPTLGSLGGSFIVNPGASLTVNDATDGIWKAFSSSGSSNPLTVLDT